MQASIGLLPPDDHNRTMPPRFSTVDQSLAGNRVSELRPREQIADGAARMRYAHRVS
jgi:hypothetical protein